MLKQDHSRANRDPSDKFVVVIVAAVVVVDVVVGVRMVLVPSANGNLPVQYGNMSRPGLFSGKALHGWRWRLAAVLFACSTLCFLQHITAFWPFT